jgi:hypothetical protein
MQVQETERTAGYRYWFDVREPGAAAYAAQLGAHAMYFALVFLVPELQSRFGWWVLIPGFLLVAGVMGAMRRLDLWAAALLAMLLAGACAGLAILGIRGYWVFAMFCALPLVVIWGSGLPLAMWAAWVYRGLRAEERWDLVGLPTVAAGTPGWKRRLAVFWGAVRP